MPDPDPSAGPRLGRVASFDAIRGLGRVVEDGGADFAFHATAITDGRRTIEVGTSVTFVVGPGSGGRYEARSVVPSPSEAAAVSTALRSVPSSRT